MDYLASIGLWIAQLLMSWKDGISTWANILLLLKGIGINILILISVTWVFWIFFVAGMNIEGVYKRRKAAGDTLNIAQWIFSSLPIAILIIIDVLFRYTYGVLLFFPYFTRFFSDYTLSNVLNTICKTEKLKDTWRYNIAKWMAKNLINPFSYDGRHIKLWLEPGWRE